MTIVTVAVGAGLARNFGRLQPCPNQNPPSPQITLDSLAEPTGGNRILDLLVERVGFG
jgi:hypothetical protein